MWVNNTLKGIIKKHFKVKNCGIVVEERGKRIKRSM